jgi:molybdopterin-guanine dinucleotide biosynthesis protein A
MPQRFTSVSGFVLAGGASRRMGEDKSKLVLAGEAMLERQLRLLRSVCRSVAVLGPAGSHPGLDVSVFPDELDGRGPLGGLYTALGRTRTEFNLVLGCDLPFLETGFLRYLCRRALDTQADVTVPESRRGRFEPLCAVYRRRALEAVRRSLESGENKVSRFFSQVRTEVIPWRDLSRAGFSPRIFVNMNTPQDYEAAKKVVRSQ